VQLEDRNQPPKIDWHLSLWLAGLAVVVTAMWFYLQLKEWRRLGPEHDYMSLVLNVFVTFLLWSLLVAASVRFFRSKKRDQEEITGLRRKLAEMERENRQKRDEQPVRATNAPQFDSVRHVYRQLRLQEKVALALVYRNSKMDWNTARERIGEFYFPGTPMDALGTLMRTNPKLLDTSGPDILIPDSVQDAVSEVLRREPPF